MSDKMEENEVKVETENNTNDIDLDTNEAVVHFGHPSKTDLVLEVQDKKFHVSKLVLSLASPVFDKMFDSDFKERNCYIKQLPGKNADSMLEFLRCIYPDTLSPVTRENVLLILPLVEEYQVLQLKPRCEQTLIGSIDDKTSAVQLFQLLREAHTYDLDNLREKCVELASKKTKAERDVARKQEQPSADDLVKILDHVDGESQSNIQQLKTLVAKLDTLDILEPLKPSELCKLEESLQWTGKAVTCNIEKRSNATREQKLVVRDIPMLVRLKVDKEGLHATLKNTEFVNVECFISVVFVTLNKAGGGEHHYVHNIQKCNFDQTEIITKRLVDGGILESKKGSVKEDRINVVAFIFLSESL